MDIEDEMNGYTLQRNEAAENKSDFNKEPSNGDDKLEHIIHTLERDGEKGLDQLFQDGYDLNTARPLKRDVFWKKGKKFTPLHEAAYEGKDGVMKLLLKAGKL